MIKKGNLFLLIRSLTRSEKRYFRLFAMSRADKNYLQLFDFIDQQESYDEKAVKEHFKGNTFVKQLHVTKIYLNDLILKSLRNYHGRISKHAEIKDLLRDIEILFRKELFNQCLQRAEKGIGLALSYERYHDLLEFYGWKRKVLLQTMGAGAARDALNELLKLEREALEKLTTLNRYWDLAINVFQSLARPTPGDLSDDEPHPLLRDSALAETVQSRILYYHIRYARATALGDWEQADQSLSDLVALLENHPEHVREDPSSYITALTNRIGFCLFRKQTEPVPALLKKIRDIPDAYGLSKQRPVAIRLLLRTYNMELELYRDTGQAERGIACIEVVTKYLQKHGKSIPVSYIVSFFYQFAYLYFMAGDFQSALSWLNKMSDGKFGSVREDIQSFGRLLALIIHFELGNISLLKYAVDSCRRFFRKKRKLFHFERVLLRFFSRISLAHPEKYLALFRKVHEELFTKLPDDDMDAVLDYLDLKGWVEGKIEIYGGPMENEQPQMT